MVAAVRYRIASILGSAACLAAMIAPFGNVHTASALDLRVVKSCPDNSCDNTYLFLMGKIESGDAARVREVLKQTGPGLSGFILRSVGGNMYESIEIGTLADQLMLTTLAPYYANQCNNEDARWGVRDAPCTCVSGCFLIWMGGVDRWGVVVGMHRPWDQSGEMGQLPYDESAQVYKKWMADLKTYLAKMELPDAYFAKFVETVRSGNMYMLTNADLGALNNHPSKTEWLSNRCGQWTEQENKEWGELNWRHFQHLRHNTARRQELADKATATSACKGNAQRQARAAAFKKMFGM